MLEGGLRRSEVCGLQWQDVTDKTITVNRAITTLRGKAVLGDPKSESSARTILITQNLSQCLKNALQQAKAQRGIDYLCQDSRSSTAINPQHYDAVRIKPFYNAFKAYYHLRDDFPVLTAHEHRHTCGTLLYRKTRDIYLVQKYLGHSTVEVTAKTYVHPDTEKGISIRDYLTDESPAFLREDSASQIAEPIAVSPLE